MSFNDAYQSLVDFDLSNESKKKGEKKETVKKDTVKPVVGSKRSRSKSPKKKVEPKKKEVINYDVPSRQYGDLYCVCCDSHMNSEQMWENHIKGKRHLKSSRKGDPVENKYEYCNEEPTIQKELDKETRPIAGLDHICEILYNDKPPTYQCFLCSASVTTSKLLMEHIMGLKHQMSFLKEHDKEKYALVDSSALSKSYLEPIVQDLISKYESEHGRGKMSVKKEKPKPPSSYSNEKKSGAGGDNKSASSKSSRYSPPPRSSRFSSPPKSSRYSPPPKSARYSPPPKSSRYSPPPRSARMRERNAESEWMRVSPVQERSRERLYSERPLYLEEENWAKIEPEPTFYRRGVIDLDTDSRLDQTDSFRRAWTPEVENNHNDLRVVLEHKKNLGMTSATARLASASDDVSDNLLHLVNNMTPEVFLSLALFKLDNMNVQEEIELKLLDRVANKATALALDIKKKLPATDLKAKYKEALAQNGISPQGNGMANQSSLDFTQNLDNLLGHFKARKATAYDDAPSQDSYSSRLIASGQSHQQLNASQYISPQERASSFESEWNQRSSTSVPFQSFSSTPTSIPGLTLTEELPAQPSPAVNQFAQAAKSIFGNLNVPPTPSNPYQNEDYNRLNYRY